MSALTKTFVVLHVVLSMLLAAGLIVFINRVEDFRKLNATAMTNLTSMQRERDQAREEARTTKATSDSAVAAANRQASDVRNELATSTQQLLDARGEIAKRDATIANMEAAARSQSAALAAAQSNQGVLQAQLIETRQTGDDVQRKLTDANLAISDLSNRNQVLERQLRNAMEEIAAMKEEAEQGGTQAGAQEDAAAAPRTTNVAINGVIRATQTIGGLKYATISVGSADAVRRGMQFRVLGGPDNTQFLGYVTVTTVEPHEAVGRLEGPRVGEINAEDEVRTRL